MNSRRPYMPDYGVESSDDGLLPWSWAVERLTNSHEYWVATAGAEGAPALTPVWGIWMEGAVWFGCGPRSRKARNLSDNPRCTVATDSAVEPVIIEGEAVLDYDGAEAFTAATNAKYGPSVTLEFVRANRLYRVAPLIAFGFVEAEFSGSPTRWEF